MIQDDLWLWLSLRKQHQCSQSMLSEDIKTVCIWPTYCWRSSKDQRMSGIKKKTTQGREFSKEHLSVDRIANEIGCISASEGYSSSLLMSSRRWENSIMSSSLCSSKTFSWISRASFFTASRVYTAWRARGDKEKKRTNEMDKFWCRFWCSTVCTHTLKVPC